MKLTGALATVTAAVVGVVLNLAVWFGLHALFSSRHVVDWFAVVISFMAFVGLVKWRWNVVPIVIGSGVAGVLYKLAIERHGICLRASEMRFD